MNTNTYTLKTNPAKFSNLHSCDQKYWSFTADWSVPQDLPTLTKSLNFVATRLDRIVKVGAFKPENIQLAKELASLVLDECKALKAKDADLAVESFKCYQIERYAFRLWYRDTRAAREATEPKPAKQEKPKAESKAKTPAKQDKPKAESKAKTPAKKSTSKAKAEAPAKADAPSLPGKMTKAQKKELVLALLSELLK